MKRSEINKALKALEDMCAEYRFALPPLLPFHARSVAGPGA